jgi:Fe-Mn family superoxide dismutase
MDHATKNWEQMTYPFFNIKLNYKLDALQPYVDAKIMQAHYNLILESYIKKLNELLENKLDMQNTTLSDLIAYTRTNNERDILYYASAVYNHFFYFSELRPATGQIIIGITPDATQKITASFGGWKEFKQQFTAAGLSIRGSGYVWLIKNLTGELEIITTSNQNVPYGVTPILCLDIWEHAYYCQRLNNRQAYIDAFWNIIDWVKFSEKI